MSKINVSGWKEFKLSDYFNICYGSFIPKKYRGDKTPFVTTTSNNNGIDYYVDSDPMFEGDALTVASDGSVGATYYHDKPFSAGNIVVVLEPIDNTRQAWTPNSAQFLATVIRRFAEIHYGWQNKFSVNRVRDAKVPLPVTSTGEPDWDYMDEYIEKLATQARKNVSSLATLKPVEHKIDIKAWKEFKVGELFDQIKTKKIPFKALDLPSKPDGINTLPLVAAGVDNQGRNRYVDPKYADALSNCLTVSANGANSGVTFYQNSNFSILQDAYALELNENYKDYRKAKIYLFLAGILNRALINNDWTNKATWARVQKKNILFPVTSTGQLNFDYMEKYIDGVQNKAHESLELLKQI